jgi:hypothetical protein
MPAGLPHHYNITLLQRPLAGKRIDPRWHRKSILNRINPNQTFRNLVGRKRLDPEGRLLDWSNITIIRSAEDALNSELLVTTLLSSGQCHALSMAFQELEIRPSSGDIQRPFADIAATRPEAGRLMLETRNRVLERVTEFFRLKAPIRQGPLQFVRRDVGAFMQPDVGNALRSVGRGRESSGGGLLGILYLNDDYEGGELYFTARNSVIKPQTGLFVAMTAGFHHEHAVLRIQQGTGLTMHSFLTFDPQN